jgi:hypothetical protein
MDFISLLLGLLILITAIYIAKFYLFYGITRIIITTYFLTWNFYTQVKNPYIWIPCYINCLLPIHEIRWIKEYIDYGLKQNIPLKPEYVYK